MDFLLKGEAAVRAITGLKNIIKAVYALHKGSELRMLVTGKTGQGKSTLINGILGAQIAKEGAGAKRCTTKVEQYSIAIEGVPVTVFDSPGLQDCTTNEEEYIRVMREQCQKLSLVFYCTKMINTRLTDDDKNAMVKLTRAFGESFWDYAVFVLTFANMENVSRRDERDEDARDPPYDDEKAWEKLKRDRFNGRLRIWTNKLHNFLIYEVGVSPNIVSKIPVVPTGDNRPSIHNPHYLKLPDRHNWFNNFWEVCRLRIKEKSLFLQGSSTFPQIASEASSKSTSLSIQGAIMAAFTLHKGSELRMLVTGKTGQGKSSLINGILGEYVAPEGARAKRCTTEVEQYSKVIEGVPVTVFDSPGLQDRTTNEEKYLQGMKEQCQKLSLVLYCTKMGNTRLTDDDKNAMIKLTEAFGEHFWDYAVFALTFANTGDASRADDRDAKIVEPPYNDEKAWEKLMKHRFEGRLQIWTEELHHFLIYEVGVSPDIVSKIPVVPTGDNKPTYHNRNPLKLPDRENWFNIFWQVCSLRIKETTLFLQINSRRMTAENEYDNYSLSIEIEAEEILENEEEDQTHHPTSTSSVTSTIELDQSFAKNEAFKKNPTRPFSPEFIKDCNEIQKWDIPNIQEHSSGTPGLETLMLFSPSPPPSPIPLPSHSPSLSPPSSPSSLPPLPTNVSIETHNNVLINQQVIINQMFVKNITVETVRRSFGDTVADACKTAFDTVIVTPVKWFYRLIKRLKD